MTPINLKFSPEMEERIISGWKCCTTRDEVKGSPGDTFTVRDRLYRIIQVDECDMFYASVMAHAEGFESDIAFEEYLYSIYPHLVDETTVYIHYFAYVGPYPPENKPCTP